MPRPCSTVFAALAVFILSACTLQPAPAAVQPVQTGDPAKALLATMVAETLAVTPTPQPSPSPTATVEQPSPTPAGLQNTPTPQAEVRTHYTLDVLFDYSQRSGRVEEQIRYVNNAAEPLTDLRLVVELVSILDQFTITGLWWEDGSPVENASWENVQLHIPLREPLPPGQPISLKVAYNFALPAQSSLTGERPMPTGYTGRQANLVDWYPFIPPYRSGVGWMAYPPAYYGEHLVYDLADFEVNLRLVDARSDLVVAASAPALQDGEWQRYRRLGARNFAISISHEYASETAKLGDIIVTSYFFPYHRSAGLATLQTTLDSLALYQELFGAYPHESLAVVEADFLDGMEYDGLYFLSRAFYNLYAGKPDDYLIAIAAHETAHQWWYGIIGSDQAHEPWLDEALCTYSERLYYERFSPGSLSWWWQYRINYEGPQGWVDSSVYNPQGILQTYKDYRNAVYLNGALFLEDLRQVAGDEAFYAFLKDYGTSYAGKIASGDDFFATLKRHSQADLQPLFAQYFQNR